MNIAVITNTEQEAAALQPFFSQHKACGFFTSVQQVTPPVAAVIDFGFDGSSERVNALKFFLPQPIFINSVLYTLAETDTAFTRFNGWPTLFNTTAVEAALHDAHLAAAQNICSLLQWQINRVPDVCGLVSPRVISMIVNEAYYALGEGVSTKEEIDTAMQLGTGYPFGPFAWAGKIGLPHIYRLLKKMAAGDVRYTPAAGLEAAVKTFL
jgi:3-hydroxybutyryl-CoA dehydrogenase